MMISSQRPNSVTRINTRLETFLARQLGVENVEFYEQEACVEELYKKKNVFQKYPFRLLLVCKDRIYLTDNPPKNLDNFICFEDILEIKIIDDVPKFLDGANQQNAIHLRILFVENAKKKKEMNELKKRIIELKKSIVYARMLEEKIVEAELNSPRMFLRSDDGQMSTFRSFNLEEINYLYNSQQTYAFMDSKIDNQLLLTNRTNKSVRFDENDKPLSENNLDALNASVIDAETSEKYKKLQDLLNKVNGKESASSSSLSLSLPSTPRSLEQTLTEPSQATYIDKHVSKSMEDLNDKINQNFIKDSDKKENFLHLYILNPKSRIFHTLKRAHFYSKLKETLNFHSSDNDKISIGVEDSKSTILKKLKKNSEIEKKFKEMKSEILNSIQDTGKISSLFDELLCAVNNYHVLKKLFWNSSDLYRVIVNRLIHFLVKTPAIIEKSDENRIKELECCITLIECFSVMLCETEFYPNRNEILSSEKCRHLISFVPALLFDPQFNNNDENKVFYEKKLEDTVSDLTLVSAILIWEILNFLNFNSWTSEHFSYDSFVQLIESSKNFKIFMNRLVKELFKLINYKSHIVLNPQETIIAYKIFSLLKNIIEKSSKNVLLNLLKQDYQEEFKYYFCEDQIKLKCFNYYPIVSDLIGTVRTIEAYIL